MSDAAKKVSEAVREYLIEMGIDPHDDELENIEIDIRPVGLSIDVYKREPEMPMGTLHEHASPELGLFPYDPLLKDHQPESTEQTGEMNDEARLDQTEFTLNDEDFAKVLAETEKPIEDNEKLQDLLRHKAPWED